MAKGQKRSNREAKKPKKAGPAKPKVGAASAFIQPAGTVKKSHSKKG